MTAERMDPELVQLRALLAALMYRETMRAFAARLSTRSLPGPTPDEKARLHAEVEERAWSLPEALARRVADRDVDDGVGGIPELEAEVGRLADAAASARPGP